MDGDNQDVTAEDVVDANGEVIEADAVEEQEEQQQVPLHVVEELRAKAREQGEQLKALLDEKKAAERASMDETERLKLELQEAQDELRSAQAARVLEAKRSLARSALTQAGVADVETALSLLAVDGIDAAEVPGKVTALLKALGTQTAPGSIGTSAAQDGGGSGSAVDKDLAYLQQAGLL